MPFYDEMNVGLRSLAFNISERNKITYFCKNWEIFRL